MVLCLSVLCSITVFAAPEVTVWEASSRIMINGKVDAASAGQYASIMLVDKNADLNNLKTADVGYLNQIEIAEGGYYKFVTTIDKAVSNYELRMNIAGQDVTESVISATTDNKMIKATFDVDRGISSADVNVAFSNELLVTGETYVVVMAYYDSQNKMISAKITEKASISADSLTSTVKASTTYVDGAETLKVFIWDSKENVIPLCDSEEIDLDTPLTVACWGDSLTYGQGGEGVTYPSVLAELTGYTVHNMGVGGETSYTIAARQGALDIVTTETFIIPASGTSDTFLFEAEDGGVVLPRAQTVGGWNPCTIAGVEGRLSVGIRAVTGPDELDWAKFTRATAGEAVVVPAGTRIIPDAHNMDADINIFFTGTNGGWNKHNLDKDDNSDEMCQDLVNLIKKQIEHTGKSKYIVIGNTHGYADATDNLNRHLAEAFGDNFLDVKAYLTTEQALSDAGLTATETDLRYMALGKIAPQLLLEDEVHFVSAGYRLIAQQVYAKMIELGYCKAK